MYFAPLCKQTVNVKVQSKNVQRNKKDEENKRSRSLRAVAMRNRRLKAVDLFSR